MYNELRSPGCQAQVFLPIKTFYFNRWWHQYLNSKLFFGGARMNFFLKVRDYLFFHSAAAGLLDNLSDESFVAMEYADLCVKK